MDYEPPGAGAHHPGRPGRRTPPSSTPGGNPASSATSPGATPGPPLAQSKYVVTQSYRTPFTEHAFLEPVRRGLPYKDGVKVYTSDQGCTTPAKGRSHHAGVGARAHRGGEQAGGGGFGGKEDVSVQHLAVLAALRVNRPVKAKLTRQESINFHPKAPLYGGHLHPGLRRERHLHRPGLQRSTSTLGPMPPCAGRCWSGPAPTRWAPTATRTPDIRGFGWYTPTTLPAFRGFRRVPGVSSP